MPDAELNIKITSDLEQEVNKAQNRIDRASQNQDDGAFSDEKDLREVFNENIIAPLKDLIETKLSELTSVVENMSSSAITFYSESSVLFTDIVTILNKISESIENFSENKVLNNTDNSIEQSKMLEYEQFHSKNNGKENSIEQFFKNNSVEKGNNNRLGLGDILPGGD